jgi:hypothetical protein
MAGKNTNVVNVDGGNNKPLFKSGLTTKNK